MAATYEAQIAAGATAYPGALWLIGNEIDHPDLVWRPEVWWPLATQTAVAAAQTALATFTLTPTATPTPLVWPTPTATLYAGEFLSRPPGNWQDGILPQVYAAAYATIRAQIKAIDPSAQIAPGSVTHWSDMREAYYNDVLAAYESQNGTAMPAEWWNLHIYLSTEIYWDQGNCGPVVTPCPGYNSGYPPGITPPAGSTPVPTLAGSNDRVNFDAWKQNLIDFRTWLKSKGYQDKPVIISEFGIPKAVGEPAAEQFMFEEVLPWLESYTDPNIGYPYDGYHLAQGWIYFNADPYSDSNMNLYGPGLLNPAIWEPTLFGEAWIDYVSTPTNGVSAWPCQWHATPGPRVPVGWGTPPEGGDGGGASGSSSSSAAATSANSFPYPPPPTTTPTP